MNRKLKRALDLGLMHALVAVTLVSTSTVASAQAAAEAPGADDEEQAGIGEIIVTATRRSENVQKIPLSVSAVGGESLSGAGVPDVRQLMQYVPGFVGGKVARGSQPSIRGVTSTGISVGDESNVATYVDGIYQPDSYLNNMEFGAIDRVEVLRGPQGTLFGRNATGGLINIITPDPKFTAAASAGVDLSTMKGATGVEGRLYVTAPITDKVAFNFAVLGRSREGYIDNIFTGKKLGAQRVFDGFFKLLFQPSDSARIILTAGHGYLDDDQGVAASIYTDAAGRPITVGYAVPGAVIPTKPYTTAGNVEPVNTGRKTNVSLRTQFELGGINLETATGYWRTTAFQRTDTDMTSAAIAANQVSSKRESISQEVRLLSDNDGPLSWIAGGYYFNERGSAIIDVYPSAAPFVTHPAYSMVHVEPHTRTEAWALFGEATYEVVPGFKLLGGVRYSDEHREIESSNQFILAAGAAPISAAASGRTSNSRVTWRASAQYQAAPTVNLYATYSTGFKSGVFNSFASGASVAALTAAFAPVMPETIKGIEGGIKADIGRGLRVNVAAFDYNYDDLQVSARAPSGIGFVIQNAAKAKIRGLELEGWVKPFADLEFHLSATYLDSKYSSFPTAPVFIPNGTITTAASSTSVATNVAGNPMIRAPKFAYSIGGNWRHEYDFGTLGITGNFYHTSDIYQDFGKLYPIPAHSRLNAAVSFQPAGTGLKLEVYGENLTDSHSIAQFQLGTQSTYVNYEEPRTFGVRASYEF